MSNPLRDLADEFSDVFRPRPPLRPHRPAVTVAVAVPPPPPPVTVPEEPLVSPDGIDMDLTRDPGDFADTLGFQHGWTKTPIDYKYLATTLHEFCGVTDAWDYQKTYVLAHKRGWEAEEVTRQWALSHGATEAPAQPHLGMPLSL